MALKQLSDSTGTYAQLKAIDPLYLPMGFRQAITQVIATQDFTSERVHSSSKAAAALVTFMLGLLRYAEVRSACIYLVSGLFFDCGTKQRLGDLRVREV
jgi:hypothetical protein